MNETVSIVTSYSADAWVTTLVLPNGRTVTHAMKRGPDETGFHGISKGWFDQDPDIPDEIVEAIDAPDHISICNWLRDIENESDTNDTNDTKEPETCDA